MLKFLLSHCVGYLRRHASRLIIFSLNTFYLLIVVQIINFLFRPSFVLYVCSTLSYWNVSNSKVSKCVQFWQLSCVFSGSCRNFNITVGMPTYPHVIVQANHFSNKMITLTLIVNVNCDMPELHKYSPKHTLNTINLVFSCPCRNDISYWERALHRV